MTDIRREQVEDSIRPILDRVLEQAASLEGYARERYGTKLHSDGSAILVPRLESKNSWYAGAQLLDTLVLLYDKIYWDEPANNLLIPDCAAEHPHLHKFGVDETFPDRFIEYMRQGIITPLVDQVGLYGGPVESSQEMELWDHLIYTNLDTLGWHDYPSLLEAFATTAREVAPADRLPSLLDRYAPHQARFPTVVRLLRNIEKSKALHADNIYVPDPVEQTQWEIISGLFGQPIPGRGGPSLDNLSLIRVFEGLLFASPCRLTVDDVLGLREAVPAAKLRAWLLGAVDRASHLLVASDPVDNVVREFEELVTEAVANSKNGMLFHIGFSAIAATLGAAVGGVPGAVAGSAAGYAASVAANAGNKAWHERFGALNWVLNVHKFRSEDSRPALAAERSNKALQRTSNS